MYHSTTTTTTTTTTSNKNNNNHGPSLQTTGTRVILSPYFVGSDRYMRAQYQDSMAIIWACGKPDLFITMVCNPKWPEITENLFDDQNASDRPDLTAWVFHLKLNAIFADLQKGVLGVEVGRKYDIEFQKRGLSHAHLLLILGDNDKPRTPEDCDKFVSAEIPDPANEQLYQTVMECMMYGPCGENSPQSPCMTKGVCSKNLTKSICDRTHVAENGYLAYRQKSMDAPWRWTE